MNGEKLVRVELLLTPQEAAEMARNTNKVVQGKPLEYRKARDILMSVNIGLRQQGVTAQ
ncbi:hypothetical protein [Streptomyces sp. B29(2018)]|uniref:hypothetical protein n=1 Tax=Streptomyces sp. B29(2018) TaxID=2485016 RepID=UPI0013E2B48D|nr:hypothetical protein [Streptomyces sp. B29(2018)]